MGDFRTVKTEKQEEDGEGGAGERERKKDWLQMQLPRYLVVKSSAEALGEARIGGTINASWSQHMLGV